ncbi:MAG: hypothetical protein K1X92_16870 [Bacteroidia bacterium]|nr:hypothetical protein [Bacteroidia bacterium]
MIKKKRLSPKGSLFLLFNECGTLWRCLSQKSGIVISLLQGVWAASAQGLEENQWIGKCRYVGFGYINGGELKLSLRIRGNKKALAVFCKCLIISVHPRGVEPLTF